MAPFSAGSSLTYHLTHHLAPFVLNVLTSLPCILPFVMFFKALFSALYSSSCTPPLSVFPSLPFPLTTTIYADDTQLFSFHSLNFNSSISHFQNTLQQISSWMTANLLTLNSSMTEFLLLGLENLVVKIHNSSLNTSHSAQNFGFIFDEHLTFSDKITSLYLQSMLLQYSSTSLYSALFRFLNCLYHCYIYCSL